MLASGAHVSIGGVEYMLVEAEGAYVHRYESLFSQSTAIAGEIAKNQLRPEKLLWSLTDFSGGEGSPIYYPQDPTSYDIASLANVSNAGLLTSRPQRYVTSVVRSGSTATVGQRPAGGSTWDKSIIFWGDNGLFSRDALGWSAGVGSASLAVAAAFGCNSDGRYMITGLLRDPTGNILISVDGAAATPSYADIFSGTTLLDAPFVTEVLDGVWYAWGIDAAASSVLALIKGGALSAANAGTLIYNSGLIPQGTWGSAYWTDMEAGQGKLFFSFATPSGSVVYVSESDVGRTFFTSEPGFVIKKLVYKLGVLFLLGAQVSAGKQFACIYAIPLSTESPIEIASPRKHKNTELSSWEAGCAGPGSTLFLGDALSGKIFLYDMQRDSLSLFDDLANGGTGDGLSFTGDGNLLPYATSTMEASTLALTGWTQESATVTLATTGGGAVPRSGVADLLITTTGVAITPTGVSGVPVRGSTSYTARMYARAASAAATTGTIAIRWYSIAGALISTSTGSAVVTNEVTYTACTVTASSPSNATYAALVLDITTASHEVDDVTFGLTTATGSDRLAFLAMHGSRLFGATWQPTGTGTSLQVITWDDLVKENRDDSQAIAASLESGEWDFGVPQEQKALIGFYVTYEVTDPTTTSGLVADSQITVSYSTDEAISAVPTYTALTTITSLTSVTAKGRHFLAVSDEDSTVKFTRLKVKIAIDNNSTAVAPPIVYSVVAEAQLMAYAETWDLTVKVESEKDNDAPRSRLVAASVLRDNLLSLATNKNIVEFLDGARYEEQMGNTTHVVIVEDPTDVIVSPSLAEGYMKVKLRAVPV